MGCGSSKNNLTGRSSHKDMLKAIAGTYINEETRKSVGPIDQYLSRDRRSLRESLYQSRPSSAQVAPESFPASSIASSRAGSADPRASRGRKKTATYYETQICRPSTGTRDRRASLTEIRPEAARLGPAETWRSRMSFSVPDSPSRPADGGGTRTSFHASRPPPADQPRSRASFSPTGKESARLTPWDTGTHPPGTPRLFNSRLGSESSRPIPGEQVKPRTSSSLPPKVPRSMGSASSQPQQQPRRAISSAAPQQSQKATRETAPPQPSKGHVQECQCFQCEPDLYDRRGRLLTGWGTQCGNYDQGCICPICEERKNCQNNGHWLPKGKQCKLTYCVCKTGCNAFNYCELCRGRYQSLI
jgi:hypothetical protein